MVRPSSPLVRSAAPSGLLARERWDDVPSFVENARRYASRAGLWALPLHIDRLEGRAALAAGDTAQAVAELERAAALFPEFAGGDSPYRLRAQIALQRGDLAGAAAQLASQVSLNENDLESHRMLADVRARLGDHAGAADALERAVYIHPFDAELHEQLAAHHAAAGNARGVVRARAALVALDPVDGAEALYQLALAHADAGDATAARRTVLRALEIAPNYEEAQLLLLRVRQ